MFLRYAVNKTEICFFYFVVFQFCVYYPERFRVFRTDDNAAGVAVYSVAESGGKRVFSVRIITAVYKQVRGDMINQRIYFSFAIIIFIAAVVSGVNYHARFFIRKKNVLVLIYYFYIGDYIFKYMGVVRN